MASSQDSRFYNVPASATSQPGLIPYPEESGLLERHGKYSLDRARHASSPVRSGRLSSPFTTPDPSWGLLEPDTSYSSYKQALSSGYTRSHKSATFSRRMKPILIISSLFPTLAATAQLILLVFFLDVYVSLPQAPDGSRPRIAPVYSIWPYVACVGNIRLTAYRIFGFLIASFYVSTFVLDMFVNWDCHTAKWLRWLRLLVSCVSGGALIAVVFASYDDTSHLHLYLVSVQAVSFTVVKSLTWAIDHALRRNYALLKTDRNAVLAKRWRFAVYVTATPVGILTVIGIYACHNTAEIQTKGSACYILAAISAICDWVYQLISVVFLLSLAYDLYQAEHYAIVRLRSEGFEGDMSGGKQSQRSGESRMPFV